jgi:hypothetical protein
VKGAIAHQWFPCETETGNGNKWRSPKRGPSIKAHIENGWLKETHYSKDECGAPSVLWTITP